MKTTNRNEIHRRRVKWLRLRESGMKSKELAVLYGVDQSTVINGIKRILELVKVYGDVVLDDSWPCTATFNSRDGRITGAMQKKRLKLKRNK